MSSLPLDDEPAAKPGKPLALGHEARSLWEQDAVPEKVRDVNFAKVDADFANPTIGANHLLAGLAWVLGR